MAFSVHDDPPVNDGRRKGKQRKRVDLRTDFGRYHPRARFRFEAKRLGKRHLAKTYLGVKGLGCFLCGDYAKEEDEAGMLDYVQTGNLEDWGKRIAEEIAKSPSLYVMHPAYPFSSHPMPGTGLLKVYRSKHYRSMVGRAIVITHTLLRLH